MTLGAARTSGTNVEAEVATGLHSYVASGGLSSEITLNNPHLSRLVMSSLNVVQEKRDFRQ